MSSLSDLSSLLQDTTAELAQMERAVVDVPDSPSLVASIRSLEKRQRSLADSFANEAKFLGVDTCSYRLFGDTHNPTLSALTKTLGSFQTLLTVVHSAVRSGQKRDRSRVGTDVIEETKLRFGYTFPGSVGVVLTLPHDRPLMETSKLDESINVVFEMAKATSPSDISTFAASLGPAPVRAMYNWSSAHIEAGLGAEIEWSRKQHDPSRLFLQEKEIERLGLAIDSTADSFTEEPVRLSAMLVAIASDKRTFRLAFEGADNINGSLGDHVSFDTPAQVPARYSVDLTKRTRVRYSAETNEVTWVLNGLELV